MFDIGFGKEIGRTVRSDQYSDFPLIRIMRDQCLCQMLCRQTLRSLCWLNMQNIADTQYSPGMPTELT